MDTYAPMVIIEVGGATLPRDISEHITSFSYEDHEDKMDEMKVTIVDMALSFVDDEQLQEGKEIRARWGYIGNLSPARICTIKEIRYQFGEDGVVKLDVTALDKRHKLTGRSSRTCWKDSPIENVVSHIATKHGLEPVIDIPNDRIREYITEGGKNDLEFLKELAEDTGCSVWVYNEELHFEPNQLTAPVMSFRYREERDGYLIGFSATSKAEEGKGTGGETETSGIDPMTKEPFKTRSSADDVTVNLGNQRVENETRYKPSDDETGRAIPSPAPMAGIAKQEGAGKVQTGAMKVVEGTAKTIGIPSLEAKDTITLENVGAKFSGLWRVKRVKHDISRSGYTCDLTLCKSDHNHGGGQRGAAPKAQRGGSHATSAGEAKKSLPPYIEQDLKN